VSAPDELEAIRERYARRAALPADRYARFNPEVLARVQERQRAMAALLTAQGVGGLDGLDLLDVGCGSGANLLEFLALGALPQRLVGNDLLDERLDQARRVLPAAVRLLPGDASLLPFEAGCFDIVHQSTVFSSILDDKLQVRLAEAMWRWLRPGGGVLWYDFTFDNPANRDVRGVPLRRVKALFPQGRISTRRITLAPPIGRRVVRVHPALYSVFNLLPFLRTHLLCWIRKP
jgi:ubiquinone/menaquinone biosynthesis C-methylase UbiE